MKSLVGGLVAAATLLLGAVPSASALQGGLEKSDKDNNPMSRTQSPRIDGQVFPGYDYIGTEDGTVAVLGPVGHAFGQWAYCIESSVLVDQGVHSDFTHSGIWSPATDDSSKVASIMVLQALFEGLFQEYDKDLYL